MTEQGGGLLGAYFVLKLITPPRERQPCRVLHRCCFAGRPRWPGRVRCQRPRCFVAAPIAWMRHFLSQTARVGAAIIRSARVDESYESGATPVGAALKEPGEAMARGFCAESSVENVAVWAAGFWCGCRLCCCVSGSVAKLERVKLLRSIDTAAAAANDVVAALSVPHQNRLAFSIVALSWVDMNHAVCLSVCDCV